MNKINFDGYMIIFKVYVNHNGEGNCCLTNFGGGITKVVVKDKNGYHPFVEIMSDEDVINLNENFGIDHDEADTILKSTF